MKWAALRARARNAAHFIVIGQGPYVHTGLVRVLGDGGRRQDTIGDVRMAMQVYIHTRKKAGCSSNSSEAIIVRCRRPPRRRGSNELTG